MLAERRRPPVCHLVAERTTTRAAAFGSSDSFGLTLPDFGFFVPQSHAMNEDLLAPGTGSPQIQHSRSFFVMMPRQFMQRELQLAIAN
jgi:hypothetical protein